MFVHVVFLQPFPVFGHPEMKLPILIPLNFLSVFLNDFINPRMLLLPSGQGLERARARAPASARSACSATGSFR